jgi:hypothetical protein
MAAECRTIQREEAEDTSEQQGIGFIQAASDKAMACLGGSNTQRGDVLNAVSDQADQGQSAGYWEHHHYDTRNGCGDFR